MTQSFEGEELRACFVTRHQGAVGRLLALFRVRRSPRSGAEATVAVFHSCYGVKAEGALIKGSVFEESWFYIQSPQTGPNEEQVVADSVFINIPL